jgi:hypothetical protein
MADRGGRRRLRLAAAWLLTAAIAVFALVDWGGDDDARIAATAGDGDGDPELRIRMLSATPRSARATRSSCASTTPTRRCRWPRASAARPPTSSIADRARPWSGCPSTRRPGARRCA